MASSINNSGELLKLLFEGDAPDFAWEKGDWELDPSSLTVKKSHKEPGEARSVKPEVREIEPERIKAQDVDVQLERTDSLSDEQKAELKGKCHVRGCGKSVLALRDFNQRYHICGEHIKAPRILRNGRVERFCQQCSRFHAVTEFEGVKRSCRKQLERHNARRRKRQDAAADSKPAVAAAAAAWGAASGTASGASGAATAPSVPPGRLTALSGATSGAPTVLTGELMVAFMQNLFAHPQIFRSVKRILTAPQVDDAIKAHRSAVLSTAIRQVEGEALTSDALSELRIGLKLRGGLPDALPENLRHTVVLWLQAEQPQLCGCMRSGCVFVTMSVILKHEEHAHAVSRGALSLLRTILESDSRWRDKHLTLQIADSIAYSQPHKEPELIPATEASFASQLPRLTWVSAPVLVTDRETSIRLVVHGQHLHHLAPQHQGSGPHGQSTPTTIIARCGHDDSLTRSTAWLGGDSAEVLICAPQLSTDGCALLWLEAWSGAYVSPAIPIFVTSHTELACRVENLAFSLMDGFREQVPFNTSGFRCSVNMYLQLCMRPHDAPSAPAGTGSAPAAAHAGDMWPHQGHHSGHYQPQQQQYAPPNMWDGGHAYDGMHPGRMQQSAERDGGCRDRQPPPYEDAYDGFQPQAQALAAAAASAAAAAAAGHDGVPQLPPAKRQALQASWPVYDQHSTGDGSKMHVDVQRLQHHPDTWVGESESGAEAQLPYGHVQLSSDVGHGSLAGPLIYQQTAFQSAELPSQIEEAPARGEEDPSRTRADSMDVPASADFSELFDSMFKE
eukprot:jgi/Ulvmu1/6801/UM031_0002.1